MASPKPHLTCTYDPINHLELDVYIPSSFSPSSIDGKYQVPAVIWFHGGGFVRGGKGDINPYLLGKSPTISPPSKISMYSRIDVSHT